MEEFQRTRKEQERERRRLRDRQKRLSMSLEEREKHLARRRKNYQLRRLRAENIRLDSYVQPVLDDTQISTDQDLALICASDPVVYHSEVRYGSDRTQNSTTNLERLDIPAEKYASFAGKFCLVRLKRLARALKSPGGNTCQETAECFKTKGNQTSTCSFANGSRLNRLKQLARSSRFVIGANDEQDKEKSNSKEPLKA